MRPHPASARALSAALAVPWSWHGRPWTGSLCVWTYCIDALMRGRVVELHAVKRVRYVARRGRAARGHAHAKSRGQAAHVVAGRCTVASGNRRVETITRGRVTRLRRVVCLERGERRGRATLSTWYVRPEANGIKPKGERKGRQDLPRAMEIAHLAILIRLRPDRLNETRDTQRVAKKPRQFLLVSTLRSVCSVGDKT